MHMRSLVFIAGGAIALAGCTNQDQDHDAAQQGETTGESTIIDLLRVALATVDYRDPERAKEDGWDLVPGLDSCFENEPTGAMGYHYINTAILDTTVDVLEPEAMVYHTGRAGHLRLGAVEYIVPAADWDAEGHAGPPEVLGQHMHLNAELGVYVLHAWIWKRNPDGIFKDWNPNVSCP